MSDRDLDDAHAANQLHDAWVEHRRVYGARRLTAEICDREPDGGAWNRKRVVRLMTVADVTGAAMLRQLTTDLDQDGIRLAVAPDVGQARNVLAHAGGPTGGLLDRRRGRRRGAEPADAELIHEPC